MSAFKLTVLNPNGNDSEQYFDDHAGAVTPGAHAPVNYHAYAACTAGSFQRDVTRAIDLNRPVLLLIRHDLRTCLKALRQVRDAGLPVAVTLKETGYHQVYKLLQSSTRIRRLREILTLADGVVSPTQAMVPVYRALREGKAADTCRFIVTPYPINDPRWDFSRPLDERAGVFVGTRELVTPSRNHLHSLILTASLARSLGCPVGIVNTDGRKLERVLAAIDFPMDQAVVRTRMSATDYLAFMARFRIVFQLDQSMVPGQVAGDCCMTRQISVGGNGSVDELVFAPFCRYGQNRDGVVDAARRLLTDDAYYAQALDASMAAAREHVSYEAAAGELEAFFSDIAR